MRVALLDAPSVIAVRNAISFLSFPYVCPVPVLANRQFIGGICVLPDSSTSVSLCILLYQGAGFVTRLALAGS